MSLSKAEPAKGMSLSKAEPAKGMCLGIAYYTYCHFPHVSYPMWPEQQSTCGGFGPFHVLKHVMAQEHTINLSVCIVQCVGYVFRRGWVSNAVFA